MTWLWNFSHVTRWTDTLEEGHGSLVSAQRAGVAIDVNSFPYFTVEPVGSLGRTLTLFQLMVCLLCLVCCTTGEEELLGLLCSVRQVLRVLSDSPT